MKKFWVHLKVAGFIFLNSHFAFGGDAKIEQVAAEDTVGASAHFTVHIEHATAEDMVKQFSKATGMAMDFSTQEGQPVGPVPLIYYDLDIKDQPLQNALDRLGRTLSRQVRVDPNSNQIQVNPYQPFGYFNPYDQQQRSGPLGVTAQQVVRRTFLPANSGNPTVLEVDFRVDGGLGQSAMAQPMATVDEASDDQGKALSAITQQFGNNQQLQSLWQLTPVVTLKCPDPAPKRIASLKGSFEWQVPKTFNRITFSGLSENKPILAKFRGYEAELAVPKKNGRTWQINLILRRGTSLPMAEWNAHKDTFISSFQRAKVSSTDGKTYAYRGGGGGGGNQNQTQSQLYFARDDNGADNSIPDVLVWDMVLDTKPLKVAFTAGDLAVP